MKPSRFTEEQIIGILREQEAGAATADICRKHGISSATFYRRHAHGSPGRAARRPGAQQTLAKHIRSELARCGSPAFVPARIAQVAALPVTFSGKRSEAAARDAVNGRPVRNRDALQNPECLEAIAKHPVLRAPPAIRASRRRRRAMG